MVRVVFPFRQELNILVAKTTSDKTIDVLVTRCVFFEVETEFNGCFDIKPTHILLKVLLRPPCLLKRGY
jgi:hypothetical protein